jgi:RHS repeat-associated protein
MASRFALMGLVDLLIVATCWGGSAAAQPTRTAFDPAAAVGMLAEATENENTAAPPFVGLASQIEVDRLFGTAQTTIPVALPPGRKGMTPDLTIRYSSNAGNGPFGVGWDLPLGSIKRNTARGVPLDVSTGQYIDSKGFVLVFRGGTILLDTCVDAGTCNSWRASSEEVWLDAQFNRAGNQWTVKDTAGNTYTYGATEPARTGKNVYYSATTFGWSLTSVLDANGNAIRVIYDAPDWTAGANPYSYPFEIHYGENATAGFTNNVHVTLAYQIRPDQARTHRGGFEERVSRRVVALAISLDTPPTDTALYAFTYQQDPDTGLSLLRSVTMTPASQSGTTPPPPTTFTYRASPRALANSAPLTFVGGLPNPVAVSKAPFVASELVMGFLDVDGDGLADFLDGYSSLPGGVGDTGGLELYRNRGGGQFVKDPGFWTTNAKMSNHDWPWLFILNYSYIAGPVIRLTDMDGDGLPDLVRSDSTSCKNPGGATTCAWNVWKNQAGALDTSPTPWPGVPLDLGSPNYPNLPGLTNQSSLIDLTGDGRPDILDCSGVNVAVGPYSCRLHQNTGSGFAPAVPWLVPMANDVASNRYPLHTDDNGLVWKALLDINGDGLPDLVCSRPWSGTGRWDVWLNTGTGFLPSPVAWPVPPFTSTAYFMDEAPEWSRGLRDMNGDGLPDYVDALSNPVTSPWVVYVNTGAGFSTTGVPWVGTAGIDFLRDTQGTYLDASGDTLDINGDGLADYVSTASGSYQASYGVSQRHNLLIKQENGLGGMCEVTYVASTDPSTAGTGCVGGTNAGAPCMSGAECPGGTCTAPAPDCSQLPFATWVVQTLTTHSGFSGTGHDLTTSFTYTNGYFDPIEHQFRGFRQSVETRVDGRKIRRQFAPPPFALETPPLWYSISTPRPFKLIGEEVWSGAQLLARTTINWAAKPIPSSTRVQIQPTKRIETTYSTATGVSTAKIRTRQFGDTQNPGYDQYNNLIWEKVSGETSAGGTPTADFPAIVTTTTYGAAAPCFGYPTRVVVTSNTLALSDKNFTYDPTNKCNLTSVWARLAGWNQPATGGTAVTLTTLEYDQGIDSAAAKTGQPTRIKDALNNATTLDYSCSQGLFPCTITNALGHKRYKTYDLRWGKPTSVTELTTLAQSQAPTTTFAYDGLGRLTGITRPLDPTPWRQFAYTFNTAPTPSRIDTLVREPNASAGTRTLSTFYDSFGRPLETKQQQYVAGVATGVVKDAVAFDTSGRVAKRYVPFTASGAVTTYTAPSPSTAGTLLAYDARDRITQTTNPDGTYRKADYTVAGQTTTLDENYNECATPSGKTASCPGTKTVEVRDALGRVTKTEVSEGSTLKTRTTNTYDGLNRVTNTTVTDPATAKSAPTDFEYDSFSRHTKMTDPGSGPSGARGVWTYAYDNAGNLLYQNDPKTGQHIAFCYDALNRVSRKLYPSGDAQLVGPAYTTACTSSTPGMPYLKYVYDAQSAYSCDTNGVGRLCAVDENLTDPAVNAFLRTVFIYDQRGRVIKEYTQRTGFGKTGAYTRTNTYDVADRLWKVTYPTNFSSTSETLIYTYDDLGQLEVACSEQSYASGLLYDVFGRLTQWNDGSGLRHTMAYGSATTNFRLTQLKVATTGGTIYEQLDYPSYDVAGNLKTLTDNTPTSRYGSTSPLRDSWTYLYDGLGRLKSAQLVGATATPFTYDGLGNMLSGNQLSFTYGDTVHPHHLTSLSPGGSVPAYHDDGGLASRPDTDSTQPDLSKSLTYDADGRIATVSTTQTGSSTENHTVRSLYDFRGERVARIVDEGTGAQVVSFYFGKWFEVTGGTLTRHIYLGGRLIADSPVAAPSGLTLASLSEAERSVLLARAMRETLRWSPQLYPGYVLTAEEAAKLGVLIAFILLAVGLTPGRVRVGLAVARTSPWRRLRKGHVLVIVLVFGLTLTPLTCVRPARAGSSGGSPPPGSVFPVYFVHADHLGSTLLLTCYKQGTACADGAVARYYRYDAYGQTKAYDVNGTAVGLGTALIPLTGVSYIPERLYTGQRWDWQAQLYYYGARFYDPRVASFLTEDPVREYASSYAYVGWNPVKFTDPTGMMLSGAGLGLQVAMALAACGGGCENPAAAVAAAAGFYASGTGAAATNGGTTSANPTGASIQAVLNAVFAQVAQVLAEAQGGGVMTAANPIINASLASTPASANLTPGTLAALSSSEPGGVTSVSSPSGAVLTGLTGQARSGGSGASVGATGQTPAPGYVDINITAGNIGGVTGGVLLTNSGYLVYVGIALTTPPGGASITASPFTASPGLAFGFQATIPALLSFQAGYGLSPPGGFFFESGFGAPAGASLTAFYAFGLFPYK